MCIQRLWMENFYRRMGDFSRFLMQQLSPSDVTW